MSRGRFKVLTLAIAACGICTSCTALPVGLSVPANSLDGIWLLHVPTGNGKKVSELRIQNNKVVSYYPDVGDPSSTIDLRVTWSDINGWGDISKFLDDPRADGEWRLDDLVRISWDAKQFGQVFSFSLKGRIANMSNIADGVLRVYSYELGVDEETPNCSMLLAEQLPL